MAPSTGSHPGRRARTARRRRAGSVAVAVLALLVGLAAPAAVAPGAAAQARLVTAWVRTFPPRPDPGSDVVVVVGVVGCPTGAVTVELYLTTSDGTGTSSTLITRAAATTNLLARTRAVLRLPQAIEGWYGARVLCGTFRPPKEPMANTLFAVGTHPGKEARLSATAVRAGSALRYSGNGCPGAVVEYDIRQGEGVAAGFQTDGTIPVGADGSWSADVTFPADLPDGTATIRARCILTDSVGARVEVYYGGSAKVAVEAAPTTTTG